MMWWIFVVVPNDIRCFNEAPDLQWRESCSCRTYFESEPMVQLPSNNACRRPGLEPWGRTWYPTPIPAWPCPISESFSSWIFYYRRHLFRVQFCQQTSSNKACRKFEIYLNVCRGQFLHELWTARLWDGTVVAVILGILLQTISECQSK